MKKTFHRGAVGAAALALGSAAALAQTAPDTAAAPSLKEVTVTGNPLGTADLIAPAIQYSGTGLLLRSQTTLGETLDGTPGVSSTYFGPNASRPVIRGLDGDRIRILNNGGGALDASGLSYDHAVTADPLTIERVEVLRGPGALQYGGSAVGGAVNVIDNRIPREPQFDAKGGVAGKADLGFATGNSEKGGGFLVETGTDRYALHADVFDRSTSDVRVPLSLSCTQGGVTSFGNRICNSASNTRGGALGGSIFFDQGYLGASVSTYRNNYGTVAEDEATIRMRSNRYALEGELRGLGGFFQSVKGQFSHTDYQHTEFDAGDPKTTFKNKGDELRIEARQAKFGQLEGMIGLQVDNTNFSADGAEAFAPYSRTRQTALFAYEELGLSWGRLSFGTRVERVSVSSAGNPDIARFFVGSRDFTPVSYALGALVNLSRGWQATSNLAYTERAPKDYELFANGPHGATGTYEVGNPAFDKERSVNLDAGVKWKSGADSFALSAFVNNFKNYISLESTGNTRDTAGNGAGGVGVTDCGDGTSVQSGCTAGVLPEYAYQQVRARFTGLEASGTKRLLDGASTLDLELRGDLVRATNLDTNQPLPRIAPQRVGATLIWGQGPWGARLGFNHAARQDRVPTGQLPTDGYTLWNAALTYRMKAGVSNLLWYARLDNIGNQLAYSATSILTQTVPGRAPLPGRSLKVGLQASF
ncbi:TonB-dependent receptor [Variovorax terrae]|uniref:TonB-dependent receptor n=1 Tax=Variovorax terrae TaxID=2923278 RepID=A0A9X1VUK6_9BURK|nr:TonB-dependent receptor [Variovorax terrae]MCJ0762299.1 TonB-dependent receptor [Variovorax terrae]